MTTLTISLPDSLKEFIDREVQTKGYGNVSEYVRGLLRDAQNKEADARLEAMLIEGLTAGEIFHFRPSFGANSGRMQLRFLPGANSLRVRNPSCEFLYTNGAREDILASISTMRLKGTLPASQIDSSKLCSLQSRCFAGCLGRVLLSCWETQIWLDCDHGRVRGFPAMRIYYLHFGDELRIVRILHGKRDINPLLEGEDAGDSF